MMPNTEALTRIHDDAGLLRAVRYVRCEECPTLIVGVILKFETLTATIRAEPNYDEILVSLTPYELEAGETIAAVDSESLWFQMFGLRVLWCWEMTNQQGYTDGLQLEFGDSEDSDKNRTVEMVVAAASIRLFTVRPTAP